MQVKVSKEAKKQRQEPRKLSKQKRGLRCVSRRTSKLGEKVSRTDGAYQAARIGEVDPSITLALSPFIRG